MRAATVSISLCATTSAEEKGESERTKVNAINWRAFCCVDSVEDTLATTVLYAGLYASLWVDRARRISHTHGAYQPPVPLLT